MNTHREVSMMMDERGELLRSLSPIITHMEDKEVYLSWSPGYRNTL